MQILRNSILLLITLLLLGNPVHPINISYSKIDTVLIETWEKTYPVPFRKILKKNINGKGILEYRESGRSYFIYSFQVAMPSQILNNQEIEALEDERVIIVKLFYEPKNKEKPYILRLGELDEDKAGSGFIRYLN